MCSIFGIVRGNYAPVSAAALGRMADRMAHRGPDGRGVHIEAGLGIGNTRLAIVDAAGGQQPIVDPDSGLVIVYNGELYNHLELRRELESAGVVFRTHSDTETVLMAFRRWGTASLCRLNGMFALAVWNPSERRLFLARDRLGIKPLYLARTTDGLAFASEAKALLDVVPGGARPDWTVLWHYLTLGYIPPDASAFAGLSKFPAGHFAWVDLSQACPEIQCHAYWRPQVGGGVAPSVAEAAERLESLLDDVVGRELISDQPVGVFLSGGLDSSAVALCAARRYGRGLPSFALRFEETTHDESADARRVAAHLGLRHHEVQMSRDDVRGSLMRVAACLDEPFGDSTVLPLLTLSEFARQHVKVVLTGWGGDEVLAGYPTLRAHRAASHYRRLPAVLGQRAIPALVRRLPPSDRYLSFEFKAKKFLRGMDLPPEYQHFLWMGYLDDDDKRSLLSQGVLEQARADGPTPMESLIARLPESDLENRVLHLDLEFFLQGNGLFQADRMTMAASLEARVPLLNADLLDYCLPLPTAVKMPGGVPKGLLKKVLAPHLPAAIIDKPKKGFGPPSGLWIRDVLPDLVRSVFHPDRIREQGLFQAETVSRLLEQHSARTADHGRALWALLSLQMWYDRFIAAAPAGCLEE